MDKIYQVLIAEIKRLFPKSSVMVNTLADILMIERGAVYRRLRKEVPFTFDEIIAIAKNLNISIDSLVGIESGKTISLQLQLPDFISPHDSDYKTFNNYIKFLQTINESENSETTSISNVLPHDLFYGFDYLIKFYLFFWNYHYNSDNPKPFHQIPVPMEMNRFLTDYMLEMKKFKKTCYVFDGGVFRFLVDRVNYFSAIRLIEKEDVLKIKEDLLSMLEYMEKMALTGQFIETGNAVNIYISDIDISTSYTYFETESIRMSMIKTFVLSYVTSFDENTFCRIKKWISALIKISTLITLTNEKQRVLFFEKQRNIINEL